ncbi:MAG: ThuA domain-containing protein [Planctomycetes bacterium]|nr:ThuA domain-containing protein [Planctomycetota bacterium]
MMPMRFLACWLLALSFAHAQETSPERKPQVLFLTHSAGFVHEVVKRPPMGLALAEVEMAALAGSSFQVRCTQDCSDINPEMLRTCSVVAFYTTGELPISAANREALLAFINAGGGFVGIHCATDTFYEWPEFGRMLGGRFDGHPWHQEVAVCVEDAAHPATQGLAPSFRIHDEIYQHRDFLRADLSVLLRLDPASVDIKLGRRAPNDHALSWCRAWGKGRVFYTALGHRPEVWKDERFRGHLLGGLRWAASLAQTQSTPLGAKLLLSAEVSANWLCADGSLHPWSSTRETGTLAASGGGVHCSEARGDGTLHLEFQSVGAEAVSGASISNAAEVLLSGRAGWQSLDFVLRHDHEGQRRVTVSLNGVPIQTHVALQKPVESDSNEGLRLRPVTGAMRFKNIWFLPQPPR